MLELTVETFAAKTDIGFAPSLEDIIVVVEFARIEAHVIPLDLMPTLTS